MEPWSCPKVSVKSIIYPLSSLRILQPGCFSSNCFLSYPKASLLSLSQLYNNPSDTYENVALVLLPVATIIATKILVLLYFQPMYYNFNNYLILCIWDILYLVLFKFSIFYFQIFWESLIGCCSISFLVHINGPA